MGKVLVFIYDDMADFEITFLTHLLGTDGGKEILPVAFDNKAIRSKCGLVYQPVKMINEVVIDDSIEGLIIPGGWNGEMRDELTHMIQVLHEKGKLLAAICAGPRFLAKAGVLAHQKYTTSIVEWTEMHRTRFGEEDPFPRQHFQNERVIRDQNIVTAKGNAFVDFAVAVCDWFSLFDDEEDRLEFEAMIKGNS